MCEFHGRVSGAAADLPYYNRLSRFTAADGALLPFCWLAPISANLEFLHVRSANTLEVGALTYAAIGTEAAVSSSHVW